MILKEFLCVFDLLGGVFGFWKVSGGDGEREKNVVGGILMEIKGDKGIFGVFEEIGVCT